MDFFNIQPTRLVRLVGHFHLIRIDILKIQPTRLVRLVGHFQLIRIDIIRFKPTRLVRLVSYLLIRIDRLHSSVENLFDFDTMVPEIDSR